MGIFREKLTSRNRQNRVEIRKTTDSAYQAEARERGSGPRSNPEVACLGFGPPVRKGGSQVSSRYSTLFGVVAFGCGARSSFLRTSAECAIQN
jgi:hypothetical protein